MLVQSIVFIFIVGLMKLAETQTQVLTEMQSTPDASKNLNTTNDEVPAEMQSTPDASENLNTTNDEVPAEMQSTPDASENVDTTNDEVSSSRTGHMGWTTKSNSAANVTATETTPAAPTEGDTTTPTSEGTTIVILRQTSIVQWLFAFTMTLYLIM